jgi:DNA-directed RNA polymerase specialized sigma subunit
MRYEEIKSRQDSEFKRLTGVRRDTFDAMLSVVENSLREFGRPPKLSRADQLLLTLTYWREYRTEFHIGADFGVSESTVCRTIKK